jgi:MFS family permease
MRAVFSLLRSERRAPVFFASLLQSALGTGAGYVALLLIAYDRFPSPWAISLVLIADLIPAMLFGPLFGAVADRWSRRSCAVAGDLARFVAFAGIATFHDFEITLAFAVLAGTGTGLFTPAILASLPSVVEDQRHLPAVNALYGAVSDLGFTVGPALAAALLLLGGPETLMYINAGSFAVSALLLGSLRFGAAPSRDEGPSTSVIAEAREGLRMTVGMPAVRVVLLGSAAVLFCGGLFNVTELFFAKDSLGAGDSGYSALVALFGGGFIAGSIAGASADRPSRQKARYLLGLLAMGSGFCAAALAPTFGLAALALGLAGFGNGFVLVYERRLIQGSVGDAMLGRVFGIKDSLSAWAFAVAFLAGGALLTATEVRTLVFGAGALAVLVAVLSALALRDFWTEGEELERGADALGHGVLGQHRPDVVGGSGEFWLVLLDDFREGADDDGVELGAGVRG